MPVPVIRLIRFCARNGLLTPKYARLALRYARRRLLTVAGWRWETNGLAVPRQAPGDPDRKAARVRFGRFVWIGDGTKIRCHEGEVAIGDKTVLGQECTISAYQHVRIGEQCVIADRAMFIDFDHGMVEVERPIRLQGIYKRDVERGLERLDRIRRVHPARGDGRRQLRHRDQLGGDERRAGQRRRRRDSRRE